MENSVKCVLLIDDDVITNIYNTKIVNKFQNDIKVTAVTSGNDGLKYLKTVSKDLSLKPDIIFLDINMPAMNGWEFLNEYNKIDKELVKDIKLVLLTTSNDPEDYKRSEKHAIHDFITKPLSVRSLPNVLKKHKK